MRKMAMFMAIDRQSLADNVMQSGIVVDNVFPTGVFGRNEDSPAYPEYNPEEAARILAESSYDGRELTSLSMILAKLYFQQTSRRQTIKLTQWQGVLCLKSKDISPMKISSASLKHGKRGERIKTNNR